MVLDFPLKGIGSYESILKQNIEYSKRSFTVVQMEIIQ